MSQESTSFAPDEAQAFNQSRATQEYLQQTEPIIRSAAPDDIDSLTDIYLKSYRTLYGDNPDEATIAKCRDKTAVSRFPTRWLLPSAATVRCLRPSRITSIKT